MHRAWSVPYVDLTIETVPLALYLAAEARAEALASQVAMLTAELTAVRAQLEAMAASDAAAAAERAKLQLTVDALLARIDALVAKKGSKKAEPAAAPAGGAPEAAPPAPDAAALAGRPSPPAAPPTDEAKTPRKARTEKVRPAVRTTSLTSRPSACQHCNGTRLADKDTETRTLVAWVAGYIEERIVALTRCQCLHCGRETPAPVPGACLPKTKYTASFAAHLLYCKYGLHLPWERIARDMASQGYPIAPSSVSDLGLRSLDELLPVARVIWNEVRTFSHNHSDATGMPVRTPGKTKTELGQMFVFGWGKVVAFRYGKDKEATTFVRLLGKFRGRLILDASSTHNRALELDGVYWACCNAHGLRKFRDAKGSDPVLGAEGERWIASWFDKEREAKALGLTGAALLAWRKANIAPLVAEFRRWLAVVHPTVLPKSDLAEATRYYINHWAALTAFLRDPKVPLENNWAERNLRAQAVGRSNWLYAGNHEAAECAAVAYTLVQTAKLHGLDVRAYLTWALERVARGRRDPALYAKLTPMAYEEAQKAEARGAGK